MFHRFTTQDGTVSTVYTAGDPDRTQIAVRYVVDAYPGEPLFCIRGRDHLAVPAAIEYEDLARRSIHVSRPVIEAVQADIHALMTWQRANPGLMKYPDR